jgi:hypothetical protein
MLILLHQTAARAAPLAPADCQCEYGSGLGIPGKSPCNSVGDFSRFGNGKPLKSRKFGAPGRIRTHDAQIRSLVLNAAEQVAASERAEEQIAAVAGPI